MIGEPGKSREAAKDAENEQGDEVQSTEMEHRSIHQTGTERAVGCRQPAGHSLVSCLRSPGAAFAVNWPRRDRIN